MENILVFGASGGTGELVVEQALLAGHRVTVVLRYPDKFMVRHPQLKIVKGDVFQSPTFENEMTGQDVVVSCLGVHKREPTTLYSRGVGNIINVMQHENVRRIICLSAGAVVVPPGSSVMMKFVTKNILQRIFKYSYADMLVMEKVVKGSNLNWSIIRPPWLRDSRPTGKYRTAINEHLRDPSKIARGDLADYIVRHLTDERTFNATIEISY